MQAKLGGTGQKLYALDCEIAALTRKLHKIATMQTAGILDPSDFTVQTGAVNSKLSSLRRQRCRILQQSEDAGGLSRLRETCDTISGMDTAEAAETQTIRSLIERIAVVSDTELEIHLRGGLIIPEHLPEKKRRCSRV